MNMHEGKRLEGGVPRVQPPLGVKILSVIYSIFGLLLILLGFTQLLRGYDSTLNGVASMLIGLGVIYVGKGLWGGRRWAAWAAVVLALFQPLWPVYAAIAIYLLGLVGEYFNIRIHPVLLALLVLFLPSLLLVLFLVVGKSVLALYELFGFPHAP
jgi:hypothetical protein